MGTGQLVEVPFGRQTVYGVVLRTVAQPDVPETKPVLDVVEGAALTPAQIELAHWLAHETLAPLSECIGLMLPAGLPATPIACIP